MTGRMFIRRTRGEYWGAKAMEAILNIGSPYIEIQTTMWGDRVDQGCREFLIFIWIAFDAPASDETATGIDYGLTRVDAALDNIPSFRHVGRFPA